MVLEPFLETALVFVGTHVAAWVAGYVMRGWDERRKREAEDRKRRENPNG